MRRQLFAFIFVALPLATAMAAQSGRAGSAVDRAALDPKGDACTDFYQFACGGWVAVNPVPPDRQRLGRFQEVLDRNFTILRRVLEEPTPRAAEGPTRTVVAGPDGDSDLRKARDYYAACMDEPAITAAGVAPVASELAQISALDRREARPDLVARLQAIVGETATSGSTRRAGYYVFFRLGSRPKFEDATMEEAAVMPDGIGLPSRDYYLNTDDRSKTLRDEYRRHIAHMLTLSGIEPGEAATGASAVLAIETAVAKAMLDVAERRDPRAVKHPMTVGELQALTPTFDWQRYLTASGAPAFQHAERQRARVHEGGQHRHPHRLAGQSEDVAALARRARRGDAPAGRVQQGDLRFLQPPAHRSGPAAASMARMRVGHGSAARRGAGQSVRGGSVRRAGQGGHVEDGAGHQGGDETRHRRSAVDEHRDEGGGADQADGGDGPDWIPRDVA